jgi:hypothetical protein
MTVLLSKFRIDYSDLVIISYANAAPKSKTKEWFDSLIRPFQQSGEGLFFNNLCLHGLIKIVGNRKPHKRKRT